MTYLSEDIKRVINPFKIKFNYGKERLQYVPILQGFG